MKKKARRLRKFEFLSFIEGGTEINCSLEEAQEKIKKGEKLIATGIIDLNNQKTRVRTAELEEIKMHTKKVHLITNQMIYQIEI